MWLLHRSIVNEIKSNVVLVVLMLVIRQWMWLPSYGWPRAQHGCNAAGEKSDHPASLNLGTNNRWKSQGIALLITFCGEMYLVIWDESCVVCRGFFVLLLRQRLLETLQDVQRKCFELERLCNCWCSELYGVGKHDRTPTIVVLPGSKLHLVDELYTEVLMSDQPGMTGHV